MIPVKLYGDTCNLQLKPNNFIYFCKEIQNLFKIDNTDKLIYEYTTDGEKYFPLNKNNYHKFFKNNHVTKIFAYSSPEDSNCYYNKEEDNKLEDEEEDDCENKNPDFYDNNIDNANNSGLIIEENKNEINDEIDQIKLNLINSQKEKIRMKRMEMAEQEKKEKENKGGKIIIEEDDFSQNQKLDDNLSNQLNNIINNNFEKLKNELINESNVQLSQIVSESKLKIENEEKDDVKTPISVEIHKNITCSGCGKEIVGVRYLCVYCSDFDYCEECEKNKGYIHKHPFYKLRYKIN
jgi:hypothetical protein